MNHIQTTRNLQRVALHALRHTLSAAPLPNPKTYNLKLVTRNSELETRNPQLVTRNTLCAMRFASPRNAQPVTRNSEPATRIGLTLNLYIAKQRTHVGRPHGRIACIIRIVC